MALHITQDDVKTNIVILHHVSQKVSGPLAGAAARLIALYATQLNQQSRDDLGRSGLDLGEYERAFIA